jgi:hypothetical protein
VLHRFPDYGRPVTINRGGDALIWQGTNVHGNDEYTDIWVRGHTQQLYGNAISRTVYPIAWR